MFIDIHSHILPGVDDGSKSLEESVEMARLFLENGTKKVFATPHYIENSKMDSLYDTNKKQYKLLVDELKRQEIDLEVYLGNEVYMCLEILEFIQEGRISTMNGSRYVLIEFPMYDIPIYSEDVLYSLIVNGYVPIIAHPERNLKIGEDPNILYEYIELGCLAQLNIPSLEGRYGKNIQEVGEKLLKHNMIHFIGADAHSTNRRSPMIQQGLEKLEEILGKEEFENLVYKNPKCIIEDKKINIKDPIVYKDKFSFRKLFKKW